MLKGPFGEVDRLGDHLLPIVAAVIFVLILCRGGDKSSHELVVSAVGAEVLRLVRLVNRV